MDFRKFFALVALALVIPALSAAPICLKIITSTEDLYATVDSSDGVLKFVLDEAGACTAGVATPTPVPPECDLTIETSLLGFGTDARTGGVRSQAGVKVSVDKGGYSSIESVLINCGDRAYDSYNKPSSFPIDAQQIGKLDLFYAVCILPSVDTTAAGLVKDVDIDATVTVADANGNEQSTNCGANTAFFASGYEPETATIKLTNYGKFAIPFDHASLKLIGISPTVAGQRCSLSILNQKNILSTNGEVLTAVTGSTLCTLKVAGEYLEKQSIELKPGIINQFSVQSKGPFITSCKFVKASPMGAPFVVLAPGSQVNALAPGKVYAAAVSDSCTIKTTTPAAIATPVTEPARIVLTLTPAPTPPAPSGVTGRVASRNLVERFIEALSFRLG